MTYKNFFIVFLIFLPFICSAQLYQFSYLITLDSTFKNYNTGKNEIENYTQSFFRKNFMDSTVISGISDADFIEINITTKLEDNYVQNMSAGSTMYYYDTLSNGVNGYGYADVDTEEINNHRFLVRRKDKMYTSLTDPNRCQLLATTRFIKTNQHKVIKGWDCYSWIPAEDALKNEVIVWICDSVPKEVCLNYISDDFTGGIVKIHFKKGIDYSLTSFKATNIFPISFKKRYKCGDETPVYNFIQNTLQNKVTMDLKYKFN